MGDRKYSFRIQWSDEDEGFIATCPEFPTLSAFGETEEEALAEAKIALDLLIDTYKDEGIPIPEPTPVQCYSGQIRLRLPKNIHARAAALAEQDGVSLNQFLVAATALQVGAEERCADLVAQIVGRVVDLLRDELVVKTAVHALSVALSPPNIGVKEEVAGSKLFLVREHGILTAKERDIHGGS